MLLEIVLNQNPQLVEKYINKYLPDDRNDLQRIYHELQKYEVKKSQELLKNQIKQKKAKQSSKKLNYYQKYSQKNIVRQSKNIMLKLRDKGIRTNYQSEQGLNIYQKKRQYFVKPLKNNPQSKFIKRGKIDQMFQKFQVNKDYYNKQVQEHQQNDDNITDVNMRQFISRKRKLFNQIRQNKINKPKDFQISKKYSDVKSRLFKSHQNYSSASTLPINQKSLTKKQSLQRKNSQANILIQSCQEYLKDKVKQVHSGNYFEQLQKKLMLQEDGTYQINKDMQQKLAQDKKLQYDKYTNTYMKLVVLKSQKKLSSGKMSLHEKNLMKDELRLRKIFK